MTSTSSVYSASGIRKERKVIGNLHHIKDQGSIDKIVEETGCGPALARDLLTLAGGDVNLVLDVSEQFEWGIESVKNAIIDARFKRMEEHDEGR